MANLPTLGATAPRRKKRTAEIIPFPKTEYARYKYHHKAEIDLELRAFHAGRLITNCDEENILLKLWRATNEDGRRTLLITAEIVRKNHPWYPNETSHPPR